MTSRRVAPLKDDCLQIEYNPQRPGQTEYSDGALIARLDCMDWLQKAGYPVDDFTELHTGVSVKTDSDDSGYLVGRIETLSKPVEDADVAVDQYSFWACSCPGFHYHRFPDLDSESIEGVGECAHVERVRRKVRESAGEGQETIV